MCFLHVDHSVVLTLLMIKYIPAEDIIVVWLVVKSPSATAHEPL